MQNKEKINNLINQYISSENDVTSNLANISAILYNNLEEINWLGFYLADNENKVLKLGPFQGLQAVSNIKYGSGVCGACAIKKETIVVDDVHCFEGHIVCDLRSRSEIVVPIFKQEQFYGLLDIDSPIKERFSNEDKYLIERIIKILEGIL